MDALPDELQLEVIRCATDVSGELDPNLDDRFRVPSQTDMEEMLRAAMPTRRALVQVSRRFWSWATPALYRSVVITHPHTINLLFKSIMECGERSLVFRHRVQRFHLSIPYEQLWRGAVPGTEELIQYLPNLKIFCGMGRLHPTRPLLFSPLDPATSFPHLEAVEYSCAHHAPDVIESISHLLRSSPNLRVFLVPYHEPSKPNPDVYAFKYLRGCFIDTLMDTSPGDPSIGPSLDDTSKQTLLSQMSFPTLRSVYFWGTRYPKFNRKLFHHITLLDLTLVGWVGREKVLDLSQFPQLQTLMIPPFPEWWRFKFSGDNNELREVGVWSEKEPPRRVLTRDLQALVDLVLCPLPVPIQRLRLLGFGLCRAVAALGPHQSVLLTWRKQLEEQGIILEGPSGLPIVEFLASLPLVV
jgi:hypothetical protein